MKINFPLANKKALASTLILKLCATIETQLRPTGPTEPTKEAKDLKAKKIRRAPVLRRRTNKTRTQARNKTQHSKRTPLTAKWSNTGLKLATKIL